MIDWLINTNLPNSQMVGGQIQNNITIWMAQHLSIGFGKTEWNMNQIQINVWQTQIRQWFFQTFFNAFWTISCKNKINIARHSLMRIHLTLIYVQLTYRNRVISLLWTNLHASLYPHRSILSALFQLPFHSNIPAHNRYDWNKRIYLHLQRTE